MRNILIGGAWPYANGSLHIGHIAGLLPGDVLARYHRAVGDQVYFVSGSDCHGTPVSIRAKQEGKIPAEVSDYYHEEFKECFERLGFSYDVYTKTSSKEHKEFVQEFHKKLYESEYVYEKTVPQAFCRECNTFLADRFVLGKCPKCGQDTRGDQCDVCGTVLEPENLVEPICAVCRKPIDFKDSKHLYIAISKLEKKLKNLVDTHPNWKKNAIAFTNRYIEEGLRDRALTRDLAWGIPVPKEGYENKSIYIWAENVLGYLSASKVAVEKKCAEIENEEERSKTASELFQQLWGKEAKHYYVHGKDNIPFHTIILPSLLLGNSKEWHLPDQIVSSEYLTLEGRKISTSQNYAIWVKDLLDHYEADSLRYFFLINGPEKKDADFSWREYVNSHNGELLGAYGNFVNRSLTFIEKYYDGVVGKGTSTVAGTKAELVEREEGNNQKAELVEREGGNKQKPEDGGSKSERQAVPVIDWEREFRTLYGTVGELIETGSFKDALEEIFAVVRKANKFFDESAPWVTRTAAPEVCKNTLYTCVQIIGNLATVLAPFLPFTSKKVLDWLQLEESWSYKKVPEGLVLPKIELLFQRIDKKVIEEETSKL